MYKEDSLIYENEDKKVLISCENKLIEEFTIPPQVRYIESGAFKNCHLLKTLDFRTEFYLEELGKDAFPEPSIEKIFPTERLNDISPSGFRDAVNIENLKSVTVRKEHSALDFNIEFFAHICEDGEIAYGHNLEEINFEGVINDYSSIDGVWYLKSKGGFSVMLLYPPAKKDKKFIMPSKTLGASYCAIAGNPYLETLVLHKDFVYEDGLVVGCASLKSIYMDSRELDFGEFTYCPNLKYIICNDDFVMSNDCKEAAANQNLIVGKKDDIIIDIAKTFKEINELYK